MFTGDDGEMICNGRAVCPPYGQIRYNPGMSGSGKVVCFVFAPYPAVTDTDRDKYSMRGEGHFRPARQTREFRRRWKSVDVSAWVAPSVKTIANAIDDFFRLVIGACSPYFKK